MPTLFEIGGDLIAFHALLAEAGGDVSEAETWAAVDGWFAEIGDNQSAKLAGYVGLVKQLEMEAAAARAAKDQFAAKEAARAGAAARLKDRVKQYLEATGQAKAEAGPWTLAVQKNGGKPPVRRAFAIDMETVPEDLIRVRREVDWDAVATALAAGRQLEFASLGEAWTHLRVR